MLYVFFFLLFFYNQNIRITFSFPPIYSSLSTTCLSTYLLEHFFSYLLMTRQQHVNPDIIKLPILIIPKYLFKFTHFTYFFMGRKKNLDIFIVYNRILFIRYLNIYFIMVDIKFIRKPSRKGEHPDDYNIKIPRLYIRNQIVDPTIAYEIRMIPIPKKKP